jgi:hypothetical protein
MGAIFKGSGFFVYAVGGIWAFFVCLGIVIEHLGFIGGVIGFMFFPVTLYFAPWYEAIAKHNWFPVMLVYGTTIVAGTLYAIGAAIDRD